MMRSLVVPASILAALLSSCASPARRAITAPADWPALLGRTVAVEGRAAEAKLGPVLLDDQGQLLIWADMDAWPDEAFGKRLRVTGTVIRRDDVPAFVETPGDPPRAGVPVRSEEDLQRAKSRFLLKDARWTVLQ